jgi:hypothetical protein
MERHGRRRGRSRRPRSGLASAGRGVPERAGDREDARADARLGETPEAIPAQLPQVPAEVQAGPLRRSGQWYHECDCTRLDSFEVRVSNKRHPWAATECRRIHRQACTPSGAEAELDECLHRIHALRDHRSHHARGTDGTGARRAIPCPSGACDIPRPAPSRRPHARGARLGGAGEGGGAEGAVRPQPLPRPPRFAAVRPRPADPRFTGRLLLVVARALR